MTELFGDIAIRFPFSDLIQKIPMLARVMLNWFMIQNKRTQFT